MEVDAVGQVREISPVFIVGAGRSGTTPMQLALNMHPSLGVYGETQAFLSHRRFGVPSDAAELRRLVRHWHHIVADQTPHKELMQEQSVQHRLSRAQSYAEVLNTILGTIAAREHKARWGEKTPSHIFRLTDDSLVFPQSRVIHMIRDPQGHGVFDDPGVHGRSIYGLADLRGSPILVAGRSGAPSWK